MVAQVGEYGFATFGGEKERRRTSHRIIGLKS